MKIWCDDNLQIVLELVSLKLVHLWGLWISYWSCALNSDVYYSIFHGWWWTVFYPGNWLSYCMWPLEKIFWIIPEGKRPCACKPSIKYLKSFDFLFLPQVISSLCPLLQQKSCPLCHHLAFASYCILWVSNAQGMKDGRARAIEDQLRHSIYSGKFSNAAR